MDKTGFKAGPKAATAAHPLDLSGLPEKRDYRRIAAFSERFLVVPKGTGALEPFRLRRWQRDLVKSVYPPTGRRPRQALWSMPRGNGKTGLAAVLAAYGLFADETPGAQVLVVASDERQARHVFNAVRRMVELSPELREQTQIFTDRLYVPATDSTLQPLPAEPGALQGFDPTLAIVDELHVVTEPVWDAMALAAGKRPESLTLAISTPADRTDSVMWRLVEHGRRNPDDKLFRLREYAAPDGCALDDREAWKIANPALGDFLHADAVEATVRTTPEASFRRYRLGQWTGSANAWLPWGAWDACASPSLTLPPEETKIVLAFDGSASGDSTALIGATVEERPHVFVVGMWEAPKDDHHWRVPRAEVAGVVAGAFDRWEVLELAADPWGWRTELEQWSSTHKNVVEWNTAHAGRMAPATDRAYAAIVEGRLTHDGDPRLSAHMSHAVAKRSALGDLISKDKRGSTRKIDAAVSAIVALDRAAWHLANPKKRRKVAAF